MVNRKKAKDRKSNGILLKLIPAKKKQLYDLAKKENKTVTTILQEALESYIKSKSPKPDAGFNLDLGKDDIDLLGDNDITLLGKARVW